MAATMTKNATAENRAGTSLRANQSPAYRAAVEKVEALKTQRLDVERRMQAEHERATAGPRLQDMALAAFDGRAISHSEPVRSHTLAALHQEIQALDIDIDMARRAADEVLDRESRAITERLVPGYLDLVRRSRAAALALLEILKEEQRMFDELRDGQTSTGSLRRVSVMTAGDLRFALDRQAYEARLFPGVNLDLDPEFDGILRLERPRPHIPA